MSQTGLEPVDIHKIRKNPSYSDSSQPNYIVQPIPTSNSSNYESYKIKNPHPHDNKHLDKLDLRKLDKKFSFEKNQISSPLAIHQISKCQSYVQAPTVYSPISPRGPPLSPQSKPQSQSPPLSPSSSSLSPRSPRSPILSPNQPVYHLHDLLPNWENLQNPSNTTYINLGVSNSNKVNDIKNIKNIKKKGNDQLITHFPWFKEDEDEKEEDYLLSNDDDFSQLSSLNDEIDYDENDPENEGENEKDEQISKNEEKENEENNEKNSKKDFIDQVENFSWRLSRSNLKDLLRPLSASKGAPPSLLQPQPFTSTASPILSHPYYVQNTIEESSSPLNLNLNLNLSSLNNTNNNLLNYDKKLKKNIQFEFSVSQIKDLQKKMEEFVILYESGSIIRTVYQKENEIYYLNLFTPRNLLDGNSLTTLNFSSFQSPLSPHQTQSLLSPHNSPLSLLSPHNNNNDKDEDEDDDDDDEEDDDNDDENGVNISDPMINQWDNITKNTLKNRLAIPSTSQITIDSIVNELNFTNPIRSSPRKHKNAMFFLLYFSFK